MAASSEARSDPQRSTGRNNGAKTTLARHLVSAAPLRTKRASDEFAATLEELGADLCVVEAARRS